MKAPGDVCYIFASLKINFYTESSGIRKQKWQVTYLLNCKGIISTELALVINIVS